MVERILYYFGWFIYRGQNHSLLLNDIKLVNITCTHTLTHTRVWGRTGGNMGEDLKIYPMTPFV